MDKWQTLAEQNQARPGAREAESAAQDASSGPGSRRVWTVTRKWKLLVLVVRRIDLTEAETMRHAGEGIMVCSNGNNGRGHVGLVRGVEMVPSSSRLPRVFASRCMESAEP